MDRCPACHRPFRRSRRYCYACEKPILKGHRYHFVGCYIQHDDCSNPTLNPQQSAPLLVPQEGAAS